MKILIIDDSKGIVEAIDLMLDNCIELAWAKNGVEGIKLLKSGIVFDLILLDKFMPIMDGISFLDELKQDTSFSPPPIILISIDSKSTIVEKYKDSNLQIEYLIKPFNKKRLIEMIEKIGQKK